MIKNSVFHNLLNVNEDMSYCLNICEITFDLVITFVTTQWENAQTQADLNKYVIW